MAKSRLFSQAYKDSRDLYEEAKKHHDEILAKYVEIECVLEESNKLLHKTWDLLAKEHKNLMERSENLSVVKLTKEEE